MVRPFEVPVELYPFKSNWAEIKNIHVHYVDEGKGPVIIFLHGNPSWSLLYSRIIQLLKNNYRCIALDLPGVASKLNQKKFALSYGNASSAIILEAGGRTRLILNLVELAPYSTRIEGNSLFVDVGDSGVRNYLKPTREDVAVNSNDEVVAKTIRLLI